MCILQAVVSTLPRSANPAAAEAIKAIIQMHPAGAQHWLSLAVEDPNLNPNPNLNPGPNPNPNPNPKAPDRLWSSLETETRKALVSGIVQLAMRNVADLRSLRALTKEYY